MEASCRGVAPVAASRPSSRWRRRMLTAKAADAMSADSTSASEPRMRMVGLVESSPRPRRPPEWRDWIGIWKAGDGDLFNYYGFAYTRARVAGHARLDGLPPGRYVARLLTDDGYAVLAQRSFTVAPRR